jgi:tyrosyl-tRNA synthetase
MYGKTLRIPDALIPRWAELLTTLDHAALAERLKSGENPKTLKSELAQAIIAQYHGSEAAAAAAEEFDRVHAGGGSGEPDEIPEIRIEEGNWSIIELLVNAKLAPSKSEARRLVEGGGVRINGDKIEVIDQVIAISGEPITLQVGRRRWARITS